jgi:hypothetical protein
VALAENLTAQSLLESAAVAAGGGDTLAAERDLSRALAMQESTLGPSHGDLAITLNNLAVVCEWLDRPADAERHYRRAHAVATEAFPSDHPQVAESRRNLEDFCRARGLSLSAGGGRSGNAGLPTADGTPHEATARPAALSERSPVRPGSTGRLAVWAALALLAVMTVMLLRRSMSEPDATPAQVVTVGKAATPAVAGATTASDEASPELRRDSGAVARESSPAPPPPGDLASSGDRFTRTRSSAGASPAEAPFPAEASSRRPTSAVNGGVKVVAARLCRELSRGPGSWTCSDADGPIEAGALYFYTRIASASGAEIQHRWYRGDELVQRVALRVGANSGDGYRTFSRQTIRAESGEWRVELRSGDVLLREERFIVR